MRLICAIVSLTIMMAAPLRAQSDTLGDIRQELSVLYVEIQRLKTELNTTGSPSVAVNGDVLQRLDGIEMALQQMTSKTETLEFRIEQVVADGTRRVSDLEFRLCDLEPKCDIGSLSDTPSLGGPSPSGTLTTSITPLPTTTTTGPELAMSERDDFDRALAHLTAGDSASAVIAMTAFLETYPGSPLTGEAQYYLGAGLEVESQHKAAARTFLNSFSGNPQGDLAPDALHHIGLNLQKLGQTDDACSMWAEVASRYPGSTVVAEANQARQTYGCL